MFLQQGIALSRLRKSSADTTADNRQGFLIIGDSLAGDTSSSIVLGPTTPAGTTYRWNGSGQDELTTQDLNNAGAIYGTCWKQFALNYNVATGFRPVFVNHAAGGSEFYPNGDTNNWYTSGALYGPMVTDANAALSFLQVQRFRAIFIILGHNDASSANTLTDIQLGVTSLITRLIADFPDTEIRIASIGRTSGSFITLAQYRIKAMIRDLFDAYTNVQPGANIHPFWDWGLYDSDQLHLLQTGNNKLGEITCRALLNPETNKHAAAVQNSFYNDQSANYAAITAFISGCQADGNWTNGTIDHFQFYQPSAMQDKVIDWTTLTSARRRGNVTGTGTAFVRTDGVAGTSLSTNFSPDLALFASQNDLIRGTRTGDVVTAAGTAFNLHTGGGNMILRSSASNVLVYNSNNATGDTWVGGDTQFLDNTDYGTDRTSSTAFHLFKNGTQVDTGSQASSAPDSTVIQLGSSAADSLPGDCEFKYSFYSKGSVFTYSSLITRINTLIAAWV